MSKIECKVTVGVMIKRKNKILLIKRMNTEYEEGKYAFPCGHVEEEESLKLAMVREVKEEVGIDIKKEDLKFLTAIFKKADKKYVNFFFLCNQYEGEAKNGEPNKCEEVTWFDLDNLPTNMAKMEKRMIDNYKNHITLDEFGWEDESID